LAVSGFVGIGDTVNCTQLLFCDKRLVFQLCRDGIEQVVIGEGGGGFSGGSCGFSG